MQDRERQPQTAGSGGVRPLAGVRVCMVPLGCPKNDVDAEYMMGLLAAAGAQPAETPAAADVTIVNTCAFIQPAVEQAIEALLEAAEQTPRVVCAGCLPQRYGQQLAAELPEVAAFCGPGAVPDIVQVVARIVRGERVWHAPPPERFVGRSDIPRVCLGSPWVHLLKIADGCSHRCTFCTIPAIRGRFRSRPLEDLIAEAKQAAAQGAREICLVAQDTASYGADLGMRDGLTQLLRELGRSLPDDVWVRVQYMHPDRLTMHVVEAVLEVPQVVPYFDLPFQHAADAVLRRMGRTGSGEGYHLTVASIRQAEPDAAIRATFIVGFPGETSGDFHRLLDFMDLIEPDHVAVFPFWPEEGTAAAAMDGQVRLPEVRRRLEEAQETGARLAQVRSERFLGRTLRVLVEHDDGAGQYRGRTFRDAPAVDGTFFLLSHRPLRPGQWAEAQANSADRDDLYGVETGAQDNH